MMSGKNGTPPDSLYPTMNYAFICLATRFLNPPNSENRATLHSTLQAGAKKAAQSVCGKRQAGYRDVNDGQVSAG
jgi:hypothetical protein